SGEGTRRRRQRLHRSERRALARCHAERTAGADQRRLRRRDEMARSGQRQGVFGQMKPRYLLSAVAIATTLSAQTRPVEPDWKSVDAETLKHFQAVVRFDSTAK